MKTNETPSEIGLLRTSNASEYVTNGELYQVFPENVMISQIILPQGIEYAKREKVFYSIGLQYLALNQDIKENLLYDYLQSINKTPHLNVPLSTQSITKIVSMIFKKKDKEGELQLIPNKKRTIIFNDMYNLTQKEKISIVNKEKGLLKQQRTKQTIYNAIEGWSSSTKITTAGIAEITGLSLRTVKTYWSEFKEYVSELNKDLKSTKKDNMVQEPIIEEKVSEIEAIQPTDNVFDLFPNDIKDLGYSEEKIGRWDVPNVFVSYLYLIEDKKGLIKILEKQSSQTFFDLELQEQLKKLIR